MTYELRTRSGARVMTFETEAKARAEMQRHAERVELKLYRIKTVEEPLT